MTRDQLERKLERVKTRYTKDRAAYDLYAKQKAEKEQELAETEQEQENLLIMKEVLERASDEARKNGKQILAETASSALQMVMGDSLRVDIELDHRAGVPVADLDIITAYNGQENRISPNDEGGGIRDLVSLATFLATGFLVGGDNKTPYFLDEPTKFVSEEYAEKAAHAIKEIIDYSGKQAIIVTHEKRYLPALADCAYELEKDETGTTQSRRLV
jgi:DNA repair exonuclease SbcCD ATPase subunit